MIKQAYFRGLMKVAQAASRMPPPKMTSDTLKNSDTSQAGFRLPRNINWQKLQRAIAAPPAVIPAMGPERIRQAATKAMQRWLPKKS